MLTHRQSGQSATAGLYTDTQVGGDNEAQVQVVRAGPVETTQVRGVKPEVKLKHIH